MVISSNPEPDEARFQSLLDDTLATLDRESKKSQKNYLKFLGNRLEIEVADIMKAVAKSTPFEDSIKLIGGQKFPDIIAKGYYGVEVKTTTQNHWTTTGNSVLEGTRVKGIERIYVLFGKMITPIEFKYKRYEDCLSDIVVTHSPRYLINMDLQSGQTIFDKLNIPYDKLRQNSNPIKPIINYYRKLLQPGEDIWWLDQEEPKSINMIIRNWSNLSADSKREYKTRAMILFPEIFSEDRYNKYRRLSAWLVNEGIVCRNLRDGFTAGGRDVISLGGTNYPDIPRIIVNMFESLNEIRSFIDSIEIEFLNNFWVGKITNKFAHWVNLVEENTMYMNLPFNLRDHLID
jgi:hypothetical protein